MSDLLSAKGTIYRMKKKHSAAHSKYVIIRGDALFSKSDTNGLIIVDDVQIAESDALAKYACLENKKVFYLFGKHFGSIQVKCTAYLGADASSSSVTDSAIVEALDKLRVSTAKATMQVQVGTQIYEFYLTNYAIGGLNHDLHSRTFTLNGVLVE